MTDAETALRRMKAVATGLLVLMVCVYVLSRLLQRQHPFLGAVSAFSEAGCVGALADWFAVVALFRHPLNLPIPKTAVIPRSRDRIGDALARFVLENFLTREVLEDKIASADLAGHVGAWMGDEKNALQMAERIGEYLPHLLDQLWGRQRPEGREGAGVGTSASAMARTIYRKINALAARIFRKAGQEETSAGGAWDLTGELLQHPGLKQHLPFLGKVLRDRIITDLGRPEPELIGQVGRVIQELGRVLTTDEDLKGKVNEWLRMWVTDAATANRQILVKLISETVKKWDPQATSRRIELHVGKDLQWIRINGTIVGGLAGLLIYFLSWMVHNLR